MILSAEWRSTGGPGGLETRQLEPSAGLIKEAQTVCLEMRVGDLEGGLNRNLICQE